jgi:hypothetical protein
MKRICYLIGGAMTATVLSVGISSAENLNFNFNNPNFGGNPNNGAFLFGLAEAQREATANDSATNSGGAGIGGGGGAPVVGGGGGIAGPTIIIPIGNVGPDGAIVGIGNDS